MDSIVFLTYLIANQGPVNHRIIGAFPFNTLCVSRPTLIIQRPLRQPSLTASLQDTKIDKNVITEIKKTRVFSHEVESS